jgi:coenzyme Q-binding protein COQ10
LTPIISQHSNATAAAGVTRVTMLSKTVERRLPYGAEQLFDLAADVERYPEFLRWWTGARIRKRDANVYHTDQTLGLGPVHMRFTSKTVLHRPRRIEVSSDESLFRKFRLIWSFEPQPNVGCRVRLAVELELRSTLLQAILERVLPVAIGDIIVAFETRAHQQYRSSETRREKIPQA